MRLSLLLLTAGVLAISPGLHAAVMASSNFNVDNEGWAALTADPGTAGYPAGGTAVLNYNPIGGNPTGYISVLDPDGLGTFFQAPAAFHGDLSALISGTLRYDIITDQSADYDGADVVIKGGGLVLVHDITPPPASSSWSSVIVAMEPGVGWHLDTLGGAAPVLSDFQTALASVGELWITGEYHNGTTETSGLDNVSLNSLDGVPEPSAALLMLTGIGAFFIGRRRK